MTELREFDGTEESMASKMMVVDGKDVLMFQALIDGMEYTIADFVCPDALCRPEAMAQRAFMRTVIYERHGPFKNTGPRRAVEKENKRFNRCFLKTYGHIKIRYYESS